MRWRHETGQGIRNAIADGFKLSDIRAVGVPEIEIAIGAIGLGVMVLGASVVWRAVVKNAVGIGFPLRKGRFVNNSVFDQGMHSLVFFYRVVMPVISYLLFFVCGIYLLLDGVYARH